MKRSPAAAFWLSLIPGIGHVYIGQPAKGLLLIVSVASAIYLAAEGPGAFMGILIPFLWIFSMIDAHRSAVELNHLIETGQQLPDPSEGFAFESWWGWALVAIGVVLMVDNYGLFDIDWIEDLWPIAIIALGIYILKKPRGLSVASTAEQSSSTPSDPGIDSNSND